MRRTLLIFFGVMLIALASIYIAIPGKVIFASIIYLNTDKNSAERYIADNDMWHKWWPEKLSGFTTSSNNTKYTFKDYLYSIENNIHAGMEISVTHSNQKVNTLMQVVKLNTDSVAIEWRGEMPETNDPFRRIFYYKTARDMKKNMAEVLQYARSFLNNNEKVYGLKILHEMVKDTILISNRSYSKNYPSTPAIYAMINDLKEYVKLQKGQVTNYPMLHVTQDSGGFKIIVALPLQREIPQTSSFITKRMVAGKILAAEVKGGINTTAESINKLERYMNDYEIKSPAIYFESLITDRMKEMDTAKWITKVYYPVY